MFLDKKALIVFVIAVAAGTIGGLIAGLVAEANNSYERSIKTT